MKPSEPVGRGAAPTTGLADALMFVAVSGVAACLVVVWAVIRRPILSLPVAVYVGLVLWLGARQVYGLMVFVALVCVVWRLTHRDSFERSMRGPLRCAWRRLWVYERRRRSTMTLSGLAKRWGQRDAVPRIRKVHCTAWGDRGATARSACSLR